MGIVTQNTNKPTRLTIEEAGVLLIRFNASWRKKVLWNKHLH